MMEDAPCHVSLERWVLGPLIAGWAVLSAIVALTMRLDCEEAEHGAAGKGGDAETGLREPLMGRAREEEWCDGDQRRRESVDRRGEIPCSQANDTIVPIVIEGTPTSVLDDCLGSI
jgi:hypothetical protein